MGNSGVRARDVSSARPGRARNGPRGSARGRERTAAEARGAECRPGIRRRGARLNAAWRGRHRLATPSSLPPVPGASAQDVLVTVEQGVLRGSVVISKLGTPYAAFRGVPYATPPLGDLRFQAPQPAASWSGVRDALEEGSACTQVPLPDITTARDPGDEDCLVLNLYVPLNTTEPPAVYVWMPGGAYFVGSGTIAQYGPDLLIEEGIAAVTVNYRLGALGFLSTEDEVIPGNAGLKDQVMALRWLQQNVAAFGADPEKVTVGGESADGSSAAHHLISPSSAENVNLVNDGRREGLVCTLHILCQDCDSDTPFKTSKTGKSMYEANMRFALD
ncbi:esterase FE4-like [Schistocerca serialis cubense]|uniref:esterase FE4-like n=1 Tax=Schistocerca serialis cubense TaxID=2023355 RepID=UPI00214EDD34|nr:esterase FE4-like [Schistocerca serialis cubense]